jgi:transketolase
MDLEPPHEVRGVSATSARRRADLRAVAAFDEAERDRTASLLIAQVKGKGVSFMEDTHAWHGKAPSRDELERALAELAAAS